MSACVIAHKKERSVLLFHMLQVTISSFSYVEEPSTKEILSNINFQLKKGEHLAILGESGCGKSTLLHLIYGLLNLKQGSIFYGKKQLFGPSHNLIPGHAFMKLVSQENTLMPYTSVTENIAEHLSRLDAKADANRVHELLDTVGLLPYKDQKVQTLSGGQKQRVALAKALAKQPEVLLLDEPFNGIDTFKKNRLRNNLFAYLKKHNISCVTATHDAEEALAYADLLAVLEHGNIVQWGAPKKVYEASKTPYQKSFFGEVSVIPEGVFSEKEMLFLPHELTISEEKTPLKISIKTNYFKGSHYLVKGLYNEIPVYFNHISSVETPEVYLKPVFHGT